MDGEAMMFRPDSKRVPPPFKNLVIQMHPERYDMLKGVARVHGVTLKALVDQMIDFALGNMETPSGEPLV
jgi:hypothetical protein